MEITELPIVPIVWLIVSVIVILYVIIEDRDKKRRSREDNQ